MSSYLSTREALRVSDAFLVTMYGHDVFKRWTDMKKKLKFGQERDFIIWVLDYIETNCVELESFAEDKVDTTARANAERLISVGMWSYKGGNVEEGDLEYYDNRDDDDDGDPDYIPEVKKFVTTHHHPPKSTSATSPKHFECQYCNKMISGSASKLKMHINSVHTKAKVYQCPHCEKTFSRSDKRTNHIKAVHSNSREFLCDQCHKTFNRSDHLTLHKKMVHGDRSKNFMCPICGKRFAMSSYVDSHIKQVHERTEDISCEMCNFKTSYKGKLKVHMRVEHNLPPVKPRKRNRKGKMFFSTKETTTAVSALLDCNNDVDVQVNDVDVQVTKTEEESVHSEGRSPLAESQQFEPIAGGMQYISHPLPLDYPDPAAAAAATHAELYQLHRFTAAGGVLQPKAWSWMK